MLAEQPPRDGLIDVQSFAQRSRQQLITGRTINPAEQAVTTGHTHAGDEKTTPRPSRRLPLYLVIRVQNFLRSRSSEGASFGRSSYPLTMERKVFHPAIATCTTCTRKNAQKPSVSMKCSQRAIS